MVDEDDGGEHDEEEEEPLVLGPDGDLMEADASNLSAEVLRAQWTVEELDVESLPNTSNRSGYVARVVNSRIPAQVLGPNRKAGAKNIPRDIEDLPYNFWRLLWDDTLIQQFCYHTNKYAEHNGDVIDEITTDEMISFFGIIIYMGMLRLPHRRKYFAKCTDKFSNNFVKKLMSAKRFEQITKNLHSCDTYSIDETERFRTSTIRTTGVH
jgi:hypothetical protein